jgi:spore germination cell wall hydrolase CwlJ-like protein
MFRSLRARGLAAALLAAFGAAAVQASPVPAPLTTLVAPQVPLFAPAVLVQPAAPAVHTLAAPQPAPSLDQLAATLAAAEVGDADHECLANAVYFEARGEPLAGQLAVAEVVLNRAKSGRYPPDVCAVVKQPWQFSFVRKGQFPQADRASPAWHRSVAIARIALNRLVAELPRNVLWYHADYVAPSWGKRLTRQTKIGLHIFYS